ncbi:MAG TPA: molybdopterin cofactor-binding domain-containing protein [Actinomycetota bacterium]|jgi:isoquinoline 1-oxidoreductase|nr:molybdopterin cofactor-binding domain-containing protein [Actinomycetota bacterium]
MAGNVHIRVNERDREAPADPERSLLVWLREELGLTGPKYGCGEGACGACTVLLDGEPVRSCILPLPEASSRTVTTIEGLAPEGSMHPAERAFAEVGAMQCGYCTPGMVMATAALLQTTPDPNDGEIGEALSGNLCRCCTYPRIVRAVHRAAELSRDATSMGRIPRPGPRADERWPRPRRPWGLTDRADRDWFDVLPPGLVVVLPAETQATGWVPSAGAWIHLDRGGRVTAFIGKVDVGQDNRTALGLRVARELHLPLEQVDLVMGDTDLCPFDPGTFGSRSMPDAGQTLARAAAGAREVLAEIAGQRWGVEPSSLHAVDGSFRRSDTGEELGYGDLVGDGPRVEVLSREPPPTVPAGDPTVRRPVPTIGALEAATGVRGYPTDVVRPGMLHGAVLRPPAMGATPRALDTSAAQMQGGTIVHEDTFVGAVSDDPMAPARALAAVRAEWNLAPQPSEGELVQHLRSHPIQAEGWGGVFEDEYGDLDAALSDAAVRLAATYTTAFIAHVPLEARAAVAEWEDGRVTVWTGTQRPFPVREEVAEALGIPSEDVRVIVPPTGAGYGGKHTGEAAVEAARLARAIGAPVKVRWSREEEFWWGYFRPAAVIDVRSGAHRDGTLTAWEFVNINSGPAAIGCPYDVPNQRIRFQPADSPLRQGSYRALAATANHFARESHIDELACELGIDPLEIRLRNLSDERLGEVFRTAAERAGWPGRGFPRGRGLGIAGGIEKDGRVATVADVRVDPEGRLQILRIVTAFDCGAIVDPDNLTNQIEGATVMGLGGALFERIRFGQGRILNGCMSDYRVPRIGDVPPVEVVLVDRPDLPPAGGGETPIVGVAPAIANAVFAATGRRLRSMPLVPDDVVP